MFMNLKNRVLPIFRQEKGQGMVEYALLVGLIAVVVIVALVALGPTIRDKFNEIVVQLGGTPGT